MKQITVKNFHSYEVQKHRDGDGKDIQIWGLNDMELQAEGLWPQDEPKRCQECNHLYFTKCVNCYLNSVQKESEPKVLPSEALYGFAAWLTTRDEAITFGSTHDAAVVADVVNQYCKAQGYEDPRDSHYPNNIVRMPLSEPVDGKKISGMMADGSCGPEGESCWGYVKCSNHQTKDSKPKCPVTGYPDCLCPTCREKSV